MSGIFPRSPFGWLENLVPITTFAFGVVIKTFLGILAIIGLPDVAKNGGGERERLDAS